MSAPEYFIDTNIFLHVIVKDDKAKAADCVKVVEAIRSGVICATTSNLVLAEIAWTCRSVYAIPKSDIIRLIRGIVGINNLSVRDDCEILNALAYYEQHSVKFIDALIATNSKLTKGDIAILSYDNDFNKMGISRVEPSNVI